MARAEFFLDIAVIFRFLIFILDDQTDRRAGRFALRTRRTES